MYVQETFINASKGYQFGSSDPYEAYEDSIGRLFRAMQKEYGRCISAQYHDVIGRPPVRIGWVFSKRMLYEDARRNPGRDTYPADAYYIREVWVTVLSAPDTIERTRQYVDLDAPETADDEDTADA